MRALVACGAIVAFACPARADDVFDRRWPAPPPSHELKLDDRIADHLSDLTNQLGDHIDLLSHDMIQLRVDMRANRARLRLGGGNARYLKMRFDSRWYFAPDRAIVHARLDLAVAGHEWRVDLPEMDVIPDSYAGQRIVDVEVPLLQRRF